MAKKVEHSHDYGYNESAYKNADLVIITTPTNHDDVNHFFNTSAVEDAIKWTFKVNFDVLMAISSPKFLRESKTLYDNLHPSCIVVGCDDDQKGMWDVCKPFFGECGEGKRDYVLPNRIFGYF